MAHPTDERQVAAGPFVLPFAPVDAPPSRLRPVAMGFGLAAFGAAVAIAVWSLTGGDGGSGSAPAPMPTTAAAPVPTTVAPATTVATTTAPTTAAVPAHVTSGTAVYQRWDDVQGRDPFRVVAEGSPSVVSEVVGVVTPVGVADNAVTRVRAWFTVPVDGDYRFWVAGDDQAWLALSTTGDPVDAKRIASCPQPSNPDDFDRAPTQASEPQPLRVGQVYYVEVVALEQVGGDHASAAWSGPTFGRTRMDGPRIQSSAEAAAAFS